MIWQRGLDHATHRRTGEHQARPQLLYVFWGARTPPTTYTTGANNYLGLSSHPAVIQAAHEALDTHGFGLSSVRFICGTQVSVVVDRLCATHHQQDIHKQLEATISKFHGTDDTILYASCFDANAGLFESILTAEDAIISDQLNHASIIDGIRLCKAQRLRCAIVGDCFAV